MRDNYALVGFMGCGKTTVGRELAKRLQCPFWDLDAAIAQGERRTIPEIFAQQGEAGFRELEHAYLKRAAGRRGALSCGGGLALFPRNREVLSRHFTTVFLDCDFETCYQRIRASSRPLVQDKSEAEVRALFESRYPIYQACCDLQVNAAHSPFMVVQEILKQRRRHR